MNFFINLKKSFLIVFLLIFVNPLFAQINNEKLQNIYGKVTYLNVALPKVNVTLNKNKQGIETDIKGEYLIKAKSGDIIKYSYIGFETISILIEDITSVLNIKMFVKTNELDEVVVKSTNNENDFNKSKRKFSTSKGEINPETSGYSIAYVNGDKIDLGYISLAEALDGKVAGVRKDPSTGKLSIRNNTTILWEVDGIIFNDEPPISLSEIESVHILKSLGATNQYGSMGVGGVVVITTKNSGNNTINQHKKNISEQYTNKSFYYNDAITTSEEIMWNNSLTNIMKGFDDKNKALEYYEDHIKIQPESYIESIKIAKLFYDYYKDRLISIQLLNDLLNKNQDNPEILKAIGYQLDYMNAKIESEKLYEKVFKLRPYYLQSYRDLANAYKNNDKYKRAWRMYMGYMLQQKDSSNQKINELHFNEMEWLYYNRKNQAGIKESFLPANDINEFRKEVRMVFEWNTSEAEFDVEFVNPNKQSYVFEYKLISNKNLIKNKKKMGSSSNEFFIDNLGVGEWLVNITYLGNKKPEPTFIKVTIYNKWGSPNQTQNVFVYNFEKENEKVQLIKLSN